MISAREWNTLMEQLARWTPLGFTPANAAGGWRHPWFTFVAWNAVEERWEARVTPGFVNGKDVTVLVEAEQLLDSGETIVEPSLNNSSATVQLPLTDFPSIPLTSFRTIGGSTNVNLGTAGELVPEFFAALGVQGSQTVSVEDLEDGTPTDITDAKLSIVAGGTDPGTQLPERILRACDIVLRCTRPRTTVDWIITPAETGTQAQFIVGSSGGSADTLVRSLHVVSEFSAVEPMNDFDRLSGGTNDPGYDEVLMATVYLLSPADAAAAADAEIDETWTPYVRHALFWNADHILSQPVSVAPQNITLNLAGLGAAAGAQLTVNQILSTSNDAFNNALQFLTAREITGTITTPGHRVAPEWDKTLSLDPPFPYVGLPPG